MPTQRRQRGTRRLTFYRWRPDRMCTRTQQAWRQGKAEVSAAPHKMALRREVVDLQKMAAKKAGKRKAPRGRLVNCLSKPRRQSRPGAIFRGVSKFVDTGCGVSRAAAGSGLVHLVKALCKHLAGALGGCRKKDGGRRTGCGLRRSRGRRRGEAR